MSIISNSVYTSEVINIGGEFMTVFLIIIFIISILSTNTRYWNKYISSMFDIFSSSLLITFAIIVAYKIMIII